MKYFGIAATAFLTLNLYSIGATAEDVKVEFKSQCYVLQVNFQDNPPSVQTLAVEPVQLNLEDQTDLYQDGNEVYRVRFSKNLNSENFVEIFVLNTKTNKYAAYISAGFKFNPDVTSLNLVYPAKHITISCLSNR